MEGSLQRSRWPTLMRPFPIQWEEQPEQLSSHLLVNNRRQSECKR